MAKIEIRHWQVNYPAAKPATEDESAERLLCMLGESTRLRLRADVPVAAYLSGGIYSTTIAALTRRFNVDQAADILGHV